MAVTQYLQRKSDYIQAIVDDNPTIVGYNFPVNSLLQNQTSSKIWKKNTGANTNREEITSTWGGISGTITNQTDLVSYVNTTAYFYSLYLG